jgi:predicted Kef-type K+ transport protein
MSRVRSIVLMTPAQQAHVDTLLRRYGYVCFDQIKRELAAAGILISRSALHRHAKRLRATDQAATTGEGATLIVITDLVSGVSTVLRTSTATPIILGAISLISPADHRSNTTPANDA